MQETMSQNLKEQTQVLESLHALLIDEQQVLRDGDYNRLNDITELKKVLLAKLEHLASTEQTVEATTEAENLSAHSTDPEFADKRTELLRVCADLNVRNGIEINKNYAFVQGILHTMVGREEAPVGYNQTGYQFDNPHGRLNATV